MKVFWTAAAKHDLTEIGDHIAVDNPARAASFVREIIAQGDGIAAMPRAFPFVPRFERQGVRRRLHGRYLIFYRLNGDQIEILHVLHGARDYLALLGEER